MCGAATVTIVLSRKAIPEPTMLAASAVRPAGDARAMVMAQG